MSGIQTLYFGIIAASGRSINIISDTANFNLRTALLANGWNGTSPVVAQVTISSGIKIYSNSTGTPAFDTGAALPTGSVIKITNNGYIVGKGGNGGTGNTGFGLPGGKAMNIATAITLTNNGTIGGGGGGGGGGGEGIYTDGYASETDSGGGGGAGAGYTISSGGAGGYDSGGSNNRAGAAGYSNTLTAGGAGGAGASHFASGGYGGTGGSLGQAGGTGGNGSGNVFSGTGRAGGAAGAAITGNSLITWLNTGSIYGSVS